MKVVVGLFVTENFGQNEDKESEGINRRTRMEVVGGVQAVMGKKKFRIQFENGKTKDNINGLLVLILYELEVGKGQDDSIFNPPPKGEGALLIFMGILLLKNVAYMVMVLYIYIILFMFYEVDNDGYVGVKVK